MRLSRPVFALFVAIMTTTYILAAQGGDLFPASVDHAAIQYSSRPTNDAVAELNKKIQAGQVKLVFDGQRGYLRSVLAALDVPIESQMLVYSPTSFQAEHVTETKPRALYFNDAVAVGWVNGGDVLEMASLDLEQGEIFWTLSQEPHEQPQFVRNNQCLECHLSSSTSGVPGLVVMSMLPLSDNQNEYAQGWPVDDRTPIEDRWGGWYVTGARVPLRHLGNVPVYHAPRSYVRATVAPVLATAHEKIESEVYLAPYSDVVALLVLNHQARMTDLLTRLGWEARLSAYNAASVQRAAAVPRLRDAAKEVVDYMLFADEARLPSGVKGTSGFAESFSRKGLRDSQGRSLRDLDLEHRLLRYPCSFMIYSPIFDALPAIAKETVYAEMWDILSGKETDQKSARLSLADRTAIIDILRDTKKGLPEYFRPITRR
jgi:hypothetical protein